MDSAEFQTPKKSRRLLLLGIGAVVLLVIVVAAISLLVAGNTKKETASNATPAASPSVKVATKDDVKQNLSALDASIKQAQTDQAAAKAALNDAKNQVKLSN